MFSFCKLFQAGGLRHALVAFSLFSAAAMNAGATEVDAQRHMVTAADVTSAKNVMLENPKKAVGLLQELKKSLETHGSADDITTVQNVYWLYAQAAADVDCVAAYRAIYQSAALGFVAYAPHRAEVYQKREAKLLQCLPDGAQNRIELEAWRELYISSLREKILLHNVKAARQEGNDAAQLAARALTAQAAAEPVAVAEAPAQETEGPREWFKSIGNLVFNVAMVLVTLSIPISIFKSLASGDSSGTPSAPEPAAPAKGKMTTGAKRATSTAKRHSTHTAKRRRVGLVRLRPWD